MAENKKIKNATVTEIKLKDGSVLVCKSKLETTIIKALVEAQEKDNNITNIQYEPNKFIIWEGIKTDLPYYVRDKKTKYLKNDTVKLRNITYTPDIVFYYKKNMVLVEVKPTGMENDTFPIKEKMFRKCLEDWYINNVFAPYYPIYCKLSCKKDVFELINILKNNHNNDVQ